jgi:hypothetical protein
LRRECGSISCRVTYSFNQGHFERGEAMLTARIEGSELVIRVPLNPTPVSSSSGKSLVVASSHGNKQTEAKVNGKPVTVGVNAYIAK